MRTSALIGVLVSLSACARQSAPAASPCPSCAASPAPVAKANGTASHDRLETLGLLRVSAAKKKLAGVQSQYERGAVSLGEFLGALRGPAWAAHDSGLRGGPFLLPALEYHRAALKIRADVYRKTFERSFTNGSFDDGGILMVDAAVAEAEFFVAEAEYRQAEADTQAARADGPVVSREPDEHRGPR